MGLAPIDCDLSPPAEFLLQQAVLAGLALSKSGRGEAFLF